MTLSRRTRVLAAVALVGTLGLTACGSDDDQAASTGEENTTTTAAAPEATTIDVKGVDYAFQGLPKEVEAGSELTFTNASDKEAHEMVLFKLPEGETRSLQELLALPEEEAGKVTGPPIAVSVAAEPGSKGVLVEGDSLTLKDAGRYIALCGLPVGSDPDAIAKAVESKSPPPDDPNAGPPHFTKGMISEFTVK